MKIGLMIIGLIVVLSFRIDQVDRSSTACDRAFGQGSRIWSDSVLGLRCLTPWGTIEEIRN